MTHHFYVNAPVIAATVILMVQQPAASGGQMLHGILFINSSPLLHCQGLDK